MVEDAAQQLFLWEVVLAFLILVVDGAKAGVSMARSWWTYA